MATPPPEKKLNSSSTSVDNFSALSTSERWELERLLRKVRKAKQPEDLEAALSLLVSPEADEEPKEDWKTNPVIPNCIFNNLPVRDLKFVRLVCKIWAQVGAPALAENTVLAQRSSDSAFRRDRGRRHYELKEFLHQIKAGTVWDSRFQLRHVELFPLNNLSLPDPSQIVEDFLRIPSLSQLDCFCFTVTSLRLETFPVNWAFELMLPYWLPNYWTNLKELKLIGGFNVEPELQFEKPSQEPPEIEVNLESLTLELDTHEGIGAWDFLKNCPKLKKVHLKEIVPENIQSLSGGSYQPPPSQISLEPFQENILQAFSSKQLETLKFTLPTVHKNGLPSNSWPEFVKRFVDLNSKTLKRFSLTLHVPESENLRDLALVLKIPKCVQVATLNIKWDNDRPHWNNVFASVFTAIYRQWTPNLKRLEFGYNAFQMGKLIIKSPTDILWDFNRVLMADLFWEGSDSIEVPSLHKVLLALFPSINYVCCAIQVPVDAGLSCKTVLLERFGKDGIFRLDKVLAECMGEVGNVDSQSRMRFFFDNGLQVYKILEPELIRQVAVSLKEWTASDLKEMKGNVFVLGHVPEIEMAEAWAKVQKSARICSSTSGVDGCTPNFAQGAHAFHRTFTSRIGESYENMCRRFEAA